ncbi:MAG: tRNA glutamyl-Q(34) synthetase GluQRS [Verrucomicrobia bacterium]|nr:tRNA glutamyl-Q(34) synthetase GluQRS [Verrucomicrobiota bacterium]
MIVGRLAPTPSGGLHLGNARTFLVAWLSARAAGGRVLLRIDDLDQARVKPGYVEQALEDLRWLGLDWDGEPLYQSRRNDAYAAVLEQLRAAGLAYPCVCSRREIELVAQAPHAGDEGPAYPGTCRNKTHHTSDRKPAWRFKVDDTRVEFDDAVHGRCEFESDDFVIFRNDGVAAYQLATVADDNFQGVTEVVRGDDLLRSTARQVLLYRALKLTPPRYLHVPLVLDDAGHRMAKRRDSTRLAALREAGVDAAKIIGALAASCGWAELGERAMPKELLKRFDLAVLPRESVRISIGA